MKGKRFEVKKVAGERNFADIGTKPKSVSEMVVMLDRMGAKLVSREGSHLRADFRRHEEEKNISEKEEKHGRTWMMQMKIKTESERGRW